MSNPLEIKFTLNQVVNILLTWRREVGLNLIKRYCIIKNFKNDFILLRYIIWFGLPISFEIRVNFNLETKDSSFQAVDLHEKELHKLVVLLQK